MKRLLYSAITSIAVMSYAQGQAMERFRIEGVPRVGQDPMVSVFEMGDVDGDGVEDFLVGGDFTPGASGFGQAKVYSSRSGALLYSVTLPVSGGLRAAGDLDGDGIGDFAFLINGSQFPELHFYTGSNGTPLFEIVHDPAIYPQGTGNGWGGTVAGIGDVDGDGNLDIAVGALRDTVTVSGQGMVYVYSGSNGAFLYSQMGLTINSRFGQRIASLGDVNGDSVPDFVVGAPGTESNGLEAKGACIVCSGMDGSILQTVLGTTPGEYLGFRVLALDDQDGDGVREFAAHSRQSLAGSESDDYFRVYSGADGSLRYEATIPMLTLSYLYGLDAIADINSDGFLDILICQASNYGFPVGTALGDYPGTGRVLVVSGVDGAILDMQEADVTNTSVGFIVGLNDVDGNGVADYVVGSYILPGYPGMPTVQVMQLGCPVTSQPGCVNSPNSTGAVGELQTVACGTALNDGLMQVRMNGLPPEVFGFLLVADEPAGVAIGNATLCLGGRISRLNAGTTGVFKTDTVGYASRQVDWSTFPAGATVLPGAVRYVQAVHRDSGSAQGFHLTNAAELMF